MQLGLKAGTSLLQIEDRLQYHPDVFEFYLTEEDMAGAGWVRLQKRLALVQQSVPKVVMHQPMRWQHLRPELCVNEKDYPELAKWVLADARQLIALAKTTGSVALIHGAYGLRPGEHDFAGDWPNLASAQAVVLGRMCELTSLAPDNVVFENSLLPTFAYGDAAFEDQLLRLHLPLAYDVSHAFIHLHGDNDRLIASLDRLKPLVRHYHLVDSMGLVHDSLTLGQGRVDWARVLPELNPAASAIYEINLKDQNHCTEMLASHHYLSALAAKSKEA